MTKRTLAALIFATAAPALAHAWQETPLPLMAQDSQAFATVDSPWKGDVFARSPFGFEPVGFAPIGFSSSLAIAPANTSFTSFTKKLSENTFVGVRSVSGFASTMTTPGFTSGYGFSASEVKFARVIGNMRPWMSASFGSLTPNRFGGPLGLVGDPSNPMFTGAQTPSFARVGAGVDFAISNNVTLGFGVSVGTVNGGGLRDGFAYPGVIGR